MSDEQRKAFEKWISEWPYVRSVDRYPNDETNHAFPCTYRDHDVDFCWLAYQAALSHQSEELKEKVKKLDLLSQLVVDHCEEAAEIRNLSRPVLGEKAVDGDSYGVPTVADIVEALVNKLNEANGDIDAAIDTLKQHVARRDDGTDKYREQRIDRMLDRLQNARMAKLWRAQQKD